MIRVIAIILAVSLVSYLSYIVYQVNYNYKYQYIKPPSDDN
jgi:hypothetical protein